ncbi:small cysteine and glycine repeat-containing protein 2-like [Penaeus monodon]|uniref:small cysteine and glycine repeat-containing protein 2-like n=1 Tax=Penaeus monodon TaxID=6687 RepID=UPI0018A7AF54|nr:small cysteine and glycine repeat-containing protein 2-like [Penaeus monodon]
MKGVSVVILCCVLAAASANNGRGSNRFFTGGFGGGLNSGFGGGFGGGFPGAGGFQGGGFPGGFGGIGGFPGAGISQGSSQCRYWCRNPENQVYCCETDLEPEGPVGTKPLDCPIVRPTCPVSVRGLRPITCSNDYRCGGVDKCCYDRCLQEHVCKPPSFFG